MKALRPVIVTRYFLALVRLKRVNKDVFHFRKCDWEFWLTGAELCYIHLLWMGFKNDTDFSGWGWWFYIVCVNGREKLPLCNWTQLPSFHLWKASLRSNLAAIGEGAHFALSRIGMLYDRPVNVSSLSSLLSFLMGVGAWASRHRLLWSVFWLGGERKPRYA